jgi:hypothetical protein
MHASRTGHLRVVTWRTAEEHVRTWHPVGNTGWKQPTIPRTLLREESLRARDGGRAAHQVVGVVTAHQADDGSLVCEDGQPDWDCDTAQTPTGGSSKESSPMGATLREQRRVEDDGLRVVNSFSGGRERTVPPEQAPANSVPAAAVRQRGQALSGLTGRTARAGGRVCGW